MPIEFFGFTNPESQAVFDWVMRGGAGESKQLVLDAIDGAPEDDAFTLGEDISTSARGVLAERLRERLDEIAPDESAGSIEDVLLEVAMAAVDAETVAEAMLRAHGMWNPNLTIPVIL